MGKLLNGKALSAKILDEIAQERSELKADNVVLTVISVGDDPASAVYVRNKKKACETVGFVFNHIVLGSHATAKDVHEAIAKEINKSSGIIIQMPLCSDKISKDEAAEIASSAPGMLDVDGFGSLSKALIYEGYAHYKIPGLVCNPPLPCTPHGAMELIESIPGFTFDGKVALVIGRSDVVGKPVAHMLMDRGCTVTIAHSHTSREDLERIANNADIIISAVGRTNVLDKIDTQRANKPIIIDVGINRDENGKLCGDIPESVKEEGSSYYTPVPGGVGPMTVAELIKNTWKTWKYKQFGLFAEEEGDSL